MEEDELEQILYLVVGDEIRERDLILLRRVYESGCYIGSGNVESGGCLFSAHPAAGEYIRSSFGSCIYSWNAYEATRRDLFGAQP